MSDFQEIERKAKEALRALEFASEYRCDIQATFHANVIREMLDWMNSAINAYPELEAMKP